MQLVSFATFALALSAGLWASPIPRLDIGGIPDRLIRIVRIAATQDPSPPIPRAAIVPGDGAAQERSRPSILDSTLPVAVRDDQDTPPVRGPQHASALKTAREDESPVPSDTVLQQRGSVNSKSPSVRRMMGGPPDTPDTSTPPPVVDPATTPGVKPSVRRMTGGLSPPPDTTPPPIVDPVTTPGVMASSYPATPR